MLPVNKLNIKKNNKNVELYVLYNSEEVLWKQFKYNYSNWLMIKNYFEPNQGKKIHLFFQLKLQTQEKE